MKSLTYTIKFSVCFFEFNVSLLNTRILAITISFRAIICFTNLFSILYERIIFLLPNEILKNFLYKHSIFLYNCIKVFIKGENNEKKYNYINHISVRIIFIQ